MKTEGFVEQRVRKCLFRLVEQRVEFGESTPGRLPRSEVVVLLEAGLGHAATFRPSVCPARR